MVGTSSTITAVTVAVFKVGLMAPINASGATVNTKSPSSAPSAECGINTASAPPYSAPPTVPSM